eukprot:COSAG01_NODE_3015_length_6719_cov_129.305996_7_plen_108_part_00
MQRGLWGQGDDVTMEWELRMLWQKGVGSSRGGGWISHLRWRAGALLCGEGQRTGRGGGLEAFVVAFVTLALRAPPECNSSRQPIRIYHTDWSRTGCTSILIRMYCRE